mmetsp:Transcript_23767/g.35461  ORF Transcript_23767/g.35461 Transcript_23767/m.35461 type:complete len:96 (-) Transcript_23767:71-358(-)
MLLYSCSHDHSSSSPHTKLFNYKIRSKKTTTVNKDSEDYDDIIIMVSHVLVVVLFTFNKKNFELTRTLIIIIMDSDYYIWVGLLHHIIRTSIFRY